MGIQAHLDKLKQIPNWIEYCNEYYNAKRAYYKPTHLVVGDIMVRVHKGNDDIPPMPFDVYYALYDMSRQVIKNNLS